MSEPIAYVAMRTGGVPWLKPVTIEAGRIVVWHYPLGDIRAKEECERAAREHIRQHGDGNYHVLLPEPFEVTAMPLEKLRQLRDQLNEIIYDKERAAKG